jgi:hypothetical protein
MEIKTSEIISHRLEWQSSKRQKITSVGKTRGKGSIVCCCREYKTAIMENSIEVPQKIRNRTTI